MLQQTELTSQSSNDQSIKMLRQLSLVLAILMAGFSEADRDARVVGGSDTYPGEFPWLVAVNVDAPGLPRVTCGGSLVFPDRVLTAAHCMTNAESVDVQAGAYNRTDTTEETQQFRVSSGWVVHPDFSTPRAEFDLAIVFLEDPFELNDSVQLAVRAEERPEEGELATLAGWGKDEDGGNPFVGADVPYKITRPVLDEQVVKDSGLYPPTFTFATVICTDTSGGHGPCKGDSGSPLVDLQGVQVGVTSFSSNECLSGVPACFTDVALVNEWIDEQTAP